MTGPLFFSAAVVLAVCFGLHLWPAVRASFFSVKRRLSLRIGGQRAGVLDVRNWRDRLQ